MPLTINAAEARRMESMQQPVARGMRGAWAVQPEIAEHAARVNRGAPPCIAPELPELENAVRVEWQQETDAMRQVRGRELWQRADGAEVELRLRPGGQVEVSVSRRLAAWEVGPQAAAADVISAVDRQVAGVRLRQTWRRTAKRGGRTPAEAWSA